MSVAELMKLPREEKLRIVETLWSDLVSESESFASPHWHEAELTKREKALSEKRIDVIDWEDGKKELRNRFK